MATSDITLKQCSRKDKCVNPLGAWLPKTTEYFGKSNRSSCGFRGECLECKRADGRRYAQEHKEQTRSYQKLWVANNPDKAAEYSRRYNAAHKDERQRYNHSRLEKTREHNRNYRNRHPDQARASSQRYYSSHRDEYTAKNRKYKQVNHDRLLEYSRNYTANHIDQERQRSRNYYVTHKDERQLLRKQWGKNHPEAMRIHRQRRRAREVALSDTFTPAEWNYCLDYFHHCCAVCGRQLKDLFGDHTAAMDHWIPLSKGGATTRFNIIPLCHGKGGCNNSKHNKLPDEWLSTHLRGRQAKQVLARIQSYFNTLAEE